MNSPIRYRKIIANKFSNVFNEAAEIVEVSLPEPLPDEIAVHNRYAGVNASDLASTAGFYTPGQNPPIDLGLEAVGEVVSIGSEVSHLTPGDSVAISGIGTGYREYAIVKANKAIVIPKATPEALAVAISGLTASIALHEAGNLSTGETILVTAAAGGTGQFAVQLAKLAGNHVIGTCSTAEKVVLLSELGVDRVVNYRQESLEDVLEKEYPEGIDLAYESVGRKMFDTAVDHLALFGRVVTIGLISEYKDGPEIISSPRIYYKLLPKSASIRGFFLFRHLHLVPEHTDRLMHLIKSGELKVSIDPKEFRGIESVMDAVDHLLSGLSRGKVVVQFS